MPLTLHDIQLLPVYTDVDVLVVGGGPAGIAAAMAAARAGASVLLLEQFNCLGGVAGAGGHGHISTYCASSDSTRIAGGVIYEVARRLVEEDAGWMNYNGVWFEVEKLKFLLERMMHEAGVRLLYHTFFCDAVVEDGIILGAVIQNKSGRQWVKARRIVDCTGDGDVAAAAGAPFEQGRPGDGQCQPTTLMFTIGGVDWPQVEAWRGHDYQQRQVWEEAQRRGDMEPFQTTIMGFWWTPTRPDQVGINFTHITAIDSTKAEDLTRATIEGRRQAFHCIDVFRKYVPGMDKCYMVSTPNTVGLRESRRIIGELVLTENDLKTQRIWDDSIGHGAFFIDIHHIDGPGMDDTVWYPEKGFHYQIPYRILLPQRVENLLVAGRCVSVTHVALGSIRVMVQCALTGEAAGAASALSLHDGVPPRLLNIPALQSHLRQQGGILNADDVQRVNAGKAWFWDDTVELARL